MIAVERHFHESKKLPVCVVSESEGGAGGVALLRELASRLTSGPSEVTTSILLLPQIEAEALNCSFQHALVDVLRPKEIRAKGLNAAINQSLHNVTSSSAAPNKVKRVVLIENLSSLRLRYGMEPTIQMVKSLQSHSVSGVLLGIQEQAHNVTELGLLKSMATCSVTIQPSRPFNVELLSAAGDESPHMEMTAELLRHSGMVLFTIAWKLENFRDQSPIVGRLRVETQSFFLLSSGELLLCGQRRESTPNHAANYGTKLAAQEKQDFESQMKLKSKYQQDMSGFMKLTLSAKEQENKAQVKLPWQHTGLQDSPKNQNQPAIHYLRDSDNDCDEDEDPDDDIDL